MKFVKKDECSIFKDGDDCKIYEYHLNDKDIDCSLATINGRYPKYGYAVNEVCKEAVYVTSGKGMLCTREETYVFSEGDSLLIDKNEVYYWQGDFSIIMTCTPSWFPSQHRIVEE